MALSDEIRHQRKRLKGKGWKAYVSYFFTYYAWYTVAIIAAAVFVGALLATILGAKDQVLGVIFMNAQIASIGDDDFTQTVEDGITEYLNLDTETYEVTIDTSIYQTPGLVGDSYDMSASEKISVQTAAQVLDGIVADASNFYYYTCSLAFSDLREVLTDEQLEQYADRIFYIDMADVDAYQEAIQSSATVNGVMTADEGKAYEQLSTWTLPDPDTMEDPTPVGIMVTDSKVLQDAGVYPDVAVIYGFVSSSKETENAVLFLEYLLQE